MEVSGATTVGRIGMERRRIGGVDYCRQMVKMETQLHSFVALLWDSVSTSLLSSSTRFLVCVCLDDILKNFKFDF